MGDFSGSDGKESAVNAGDLGSVPGLGRSPGGGNGNPLQYFCLDNSMDRGAWWATVYESERVGHDRVANSFIFKTICSSGNEMERDLMVLLPASLPLWPGPPPAFVCGKALTKD